MSDDLQFSPKCAMVSEKNEHWNYSTYANKHYRYMYKLGLYKTILTKDFIFLYVNIIYF